MIEAPIIRQIEFPIIAVDDLTGFAKGAIAEAVNHIGRAERIAAKHARANGIQCARTLVRIIDILAEERIASGWCVRLLNGRALEIHRLRQDQLRRYHRLHGREVVTAFGGDNGIGTERIDRERIISARITRRGLRLG